MAGIKPVMEMVEMFPADHSALFARMMDKREDGGLVKAAQYTKPSDDKATERTRDASDEVTPIRTIIGAGWRSRKLTDKIRAKLDNPIECLESIKQLEEQGEND